MLAHPLLDPGGLRVPPISAAVAAALIVTLVGRFWPGPDPPRAQQAHLEVQSWHGRLRGPTILTRVVAVGLLVLAVVAGRVGSTQELENLAPALVVGTAWPMLVLASAFLGSVWRWVDPWDALARPVAPSGEAGGDVRWAAIPALALTWYLGAYPTPLHPRAVGLVLAGYSIVTLAGCLALGRTSWLSRVEVFGLVFGWTALLRRGALRSWRPPRGATLFLAALAGGLTFGAIRRSTLWGDLNVAEHALLLATGGLAVVAGGFALLLGWADRRAGAVGAPGSVAAAMVPAVAAVAVAMALARNRLFTSVQLLPGLLTDPFGSGDGPLARGSSLDPEPLGTVGLVAAQVGILLAGHLLGALVLARRATVQQRQPGMVGLAVSMAVTMAAVTANHV
ncbi:MAG: hypothetical protein ACRDHJ_04080 [Actinomycetota bacterium]